MLQVERDLPAGMSAVPPSPSDNISVSSARQALPPRKPRRSRFASRPNEELYLPPFRVAELQKVAQSREVSALDRQRLHWESLRKKINGIVNRANKKNAPFFVLKLFNLNIVRGMGLVCRSFMRAQLVSSDFTAVFASIIAAINTRVPEIGELILFRLVAQLKRGMEESDRGACIASIRFIAHLFNQSVVDALLPLEIMNVLMVRPTDDSIELLVMFMNECGSLLQQSEPAMVDDLFQMLRHMIQEGEVSNRIQYLVEGLMTLRRNAFGNAPPIPSELDLVDDDERIIHAVSFTEEHDARNELDNFVFDEAWELAELKYMEFRRDILMEDDDLLFENADTKQGVNHPNSTAANARGGVEDEDEIHMSGVAAAQSIDDTRGSNANAVSNMTEEQLVSFRRKVYLIIMSAASYEECAHKLVGLMRSRQGEEAELCNMILECCAQERTFMRFYGLLGQRFCNLSKKYVECFEEAFALHYATIHQYDSRKIRNLANFYAFLLCSEALPLSVLAVVHLSLEETTSSSRIFLKYLLVEMAQTLTLSDLDARLNRQDVAPFLVGMFPVDNVENIRFAIDMLTSIGLGPLTDGLRERLQQFEMKQNQPNVEPDADDGESSSSLSSSSSSLSSSSSSYSSSSLSPEHHRSADDSDPDVYPAAATDARERRRDYSVKRHGAIAIESGDPENHVNTVMQSGSRGRDLNDPKHGYVRGQPPSRRTSMSHRLDESSREPLTRPPRGRGRGLTMPAWIDREPRRENDAFQHVARESRSISRSLSPRRDSNRAIRFSPRRNISYSRKGGSVSPEHYPLDRQMRGRPEKRRRIDSPGGFSRRSRDRSRDRYLSPERRFSLSPRRLSGIPHRRISLSPPYPARLSIRPRGRPLHREQGGTALARRDSAPRKSRDRSESLSPDKESRRLSGQRSRRSLSRSPSRSCSPASSRSQSSRSVFSTSSRSWSRTPSESPNRESFSPSDRGPRRGRHNSRFSSRRHSETGRQ